MSVTNINLESICSNPGSNSGLISACGCYNASKSLTNALNEYKNQMEKYTSDKDIWD